MKEKEFIIFKAWLVAQDYEMEECRGKYEVLRWKSIIEGQAKPIVFKRNDGKYTINKEARPYYLDWKDGFV
tara:strand:+ start:787 stop:999 length:213 start_codon:yes stop_codon:yes gene_type:complete